MNTAGAGLADKGLAAGAGLAGVGLAAAGVGAGFVLLLSFVSADMKAGTSCSGDFGLYAISFVNVYLSSKN